MQNILLCGNLALDTCSLHGTSRWYQHLAVRFGLILCFCSISVSFGFHAVLSCHTLTEFFFLPLGKKSIFKNIFFKYCIFGMLWLSFHNMSHCECLFMRWKGRIYVYIQLMVQSYELLTLPAKGFWQHKYFYGCCKCDNVSMA